MAVELERLRSLRCSIGMAASREKVPAILGALRSCYINVLITDEETAKILLNE
nr:sugar-binding domain-containing protein [Selenomonas noxia]